MFLAFYDEYENDERDKDRIRQEERYDEFKAPLLGLRLGGDRN